MIFNGKAIYNFGEIHDYVIITTDELKNATDELKNWKEAIGYSVKVLTTSWIETNYDGIDLQEKIRNFLIDKYKEWEIDYVLIVGSSDKIPMRTCYLNPYNHEDEYSIVETDYYYADLTGSWDFDSDGYFGEWRQDKPDFYPEVYVGRIPSNEKERVRNICQSIINFESSNETWKRNALLIGAILYYKNYTDMWGKWNLVDGAALMEKCRQNIFQQNGFDVTTLYEKEGLNPSKYPCDYKLNHSNVLMEYKKGYGIVNMVGHSSSSGIYRWIWVKDDGDNIPEADELTFRNFIKGGDAEEIATEKPSIVFSAGCKQLEGQWNMGRTFIEEGAAVAFIGATSYSWINITLKWNNINDGGALSLDYYFFHYLINKQQKIGNALYNAKAYYYNHFGFPITPKDYKIPWFYANLYGFNLFGDPSLGLFDGRIDSDPPEVRIEKPKNYLYIFDKEIVPTRNAIIIGKITVEASVSDDVEKVEFYVDNSLEACIESEPYSWIWTKSLGMHKLKVVAYDIVGNIGGEELNAFIFSF